MRASVIGLGKLGLPWACVLGEAGHDVIGVDRDEDTVKKLQTNYCPINEPGLSELLFNRTRLSFTTDTHQAVADSDITFIIVPTPSLPNTHEFSNEYVLQAIKEIGSAISDKRSEHTVVVTSTVMPGASENVLIPALEEAVGRKIGEELNYAYSPEFIALGSVVNDMKNPDFVLIGEANQRAADVLDVIYRSYLNDDVELVHMNVINAEITKIALNCFLTMKISFANMVSEFCEQWPGGNAQTVCKAIGKDSRIGLKYIAPGTAVGGPCLPRDLKALDYAMGQKSVEDELVEAAISVNDRQSARIRSIIDKYAPKTVGILGTAYKAGTHITEGSPGLTLCKNLGSKYIILCYDSQAVGWNDLDKVIEQVDLAVIMTAAPEFTSFDFGDTVVIDPWDIAKIGSNIVRLGEG